VAHDPSVADYRATFPYEWGGIYSSILTLPVSLSTMTWLS
jgi:hypothetical protein